MPDPVIINQPPTSDTFQPVGRCWNPNAVFDASITDASTVNGDIRCEPENVIAPIKNGVCKEFDCPFNTMSILPRWLRR